MDQLEEIRVHCPYCGAGFVTFVESAYAPQAYIEDCRSCCSPIELSVELNAHDEGVQVFTRRGDE